MELATFEWLLTSDGQQMLAMLTPADLRDEARLATLSRLRLMVNAARAAAVYETALLRERATAKFSRAAAMFFTREALEQASGEMITSYRATRFHSYTTLADLCCGIGGDTVALAANANVIATDYDKLRLAMAMANAQAYGLADCVVPTYADLEQEMPPAADAAFFDPARRVAGKRVFSLAAYQPSLHHLTAWLQQTPAMGMKIGPGVDDSEVATLPPHEVEFISVDGELREAVLWFGPLGTVGRRATILGARGWRLGDSSANNPLPATLFALTPRSGGATSEPGAFLYEPDPAVIRAHVVLDVAEQLGAAQLDQSIAYLTADTQITTPFARCWRILEWLPFNLKRLRIRLHALDAGAITVKKRGSPLDSNEFARKLSSHGSRPLVVVFTRLRGAPIALICEGPLG